MAEPHICISWVCFPSIEDLGRQSLSGLDQPSSSIHYMQLGRLAWSMCGSPHEICSQGDCISFISSSLHVICGGGERGTAALQDAETSAFDNDLLAT